MKKSYLAMALLTAISLTVVGCGKKNDATKAQAAAAQKMPPPTVSVQAVEFQNVPQYQTLSGRTAAFQTADVRPQVSGIVDEILFSEGSVVKEGQPLYRINPDNYSTSVASGQAAVQQSQASLATAQANLASQNANLAQALADLNRFKALVNIDAVSKQQYEQAITQVKTAQAGVESAKAAIAQAKAGIETAKANLAANRLNLNRTIVRAPISGKTGRSSVTAGALVNANQAQPLVTVSRLNPIYVDISQSSSELLKLRQQLASGKAQQGINKVELVLEDGTIYPLQGRLALAEAKVDETSGAVTLRAIFDNSERVLLPGMYVTARLAQSIIPNAVLVPQSALMRTPKGDTQVYLVDKNNKIQIRPVTVNGTYEGKWIVTDGLQMGENVVVEGGSKVQPDQEVTVAVNAQQNPPANAPFAPKAEAKADAKQNAQATQQNEHKTEQAAQQ